MSQDCSDIFIAGICHCSPPPHENEIGKMLYVEFRFLENVVLSLS